MTTPTFAKMWGIEKFKGQRGNGLIVIAWQVMLSRPVSIDLIDVVIRAMATAIAAFTALSALRRWEQRALRRGRGGRR